MLTVQEAKKGIADGTIKGGMVAKMESVFEALQGNVPRVHIAKWQGEETLEHLTDKGFSIGTTIRV